MASVAGSGFDAAAFRQGIHFAMQMGLPPDPDEQIKFFFADTKTPFSLTAPEDGEGVPFDPSVAVLRTPGASVQAACAVEYLDASNEPTNFGDVPPAKVRITLLDEDYAMVKGFSYAVIGGERYDYQRTEAPLGLFEVGVFQVMLLRA